MALTAKQERFVAEYLLSLNATDAARKAGYAHATTQGPRLLENVGVAEAIASAQAERAERVKVDQDYVLASIVDTMERCKQAEPVVDRKGDPVMVETPSGEMVPAYTFNAMGVFKGAELLAKHLGMFVDRIDHTSSDGSMTPKPTTIDTSKMSTDALRELMGALNEAPPANKG